MDHGLWTELFRNFNKNEPMSRIIYSCIAVLLLACSPYKKVTVTMSEIQTNKWKGATEATVLDALGEYKKKEPDENGYSLLFDYSHTTVSKLYNAKDAISIRANNKPAQGLTPRDNPPRSDPAARTYSTDQTVKQMEFHFDKTNHVTVVYAQGYPDSVSYVKRK